MDLRDIAGIERRRGEVEGRDMHGHALASQRPHHAEERAHIAADDQRHMPRILQCGAVEVARLGWSVWFQLHCCSLFLVKPLGAPVPVLSRAQFLIAASNDGETNTERKRSTARYAL